MRRSGQGAVCRRDARVGFTWSTSGFAAFSVVAVVGGSAATAADLLPHRAVYDLFPLEGRPQMNDAASSLSGRMVFEFTGSKCEGYTVNFRFVIEMSDDQGRNVVTDLRTSSFEEGDGSRFQFLSQTYSNQMLTEEVKGSATRTADEMTLQLVSPRETERTYSPPPIFPTDHLRKIIEAAEGGERILAQEVFDGSESGDKVHGTTAMIGPPRSGAPAPEDAIVGEGLQRWPVSVAYFDAAAVGDQTPQYSIAFDLWENGVSTDLTMDYGDFALAGRLAEYQALPVSRCDEPQ